MTHPQVKVCGLTDAETAASCAALGVDAIGCVFYPKSPRFISDRLARKICRGLPPAVQAVGVFVDHSFSQIMQKAEYCGLTAVQLHGRESPELVNRLMAENLVVIKALFLQKAPSVETAGEYSASAYLVEQGRGRLPGGNAERWNWGTINRFGKCRPLILAGGLSPDNVTDAIESCMPDAVDVSSGVESAPGTKDIAKVKAFLSAASDGDRSRQSAKPIF
jgi:phosphoribosylanthranilate isomerase